MKICLNNNKEYEVTQINQSSNKVYKDPDNFIIQIIVQLEMNDPNLSVEELESESQEFKRVIVKNSDDKIKLVLKDYNIDRIERVIRESNDSLIVVLLKNLEEGESIS